MRYHSWETVGEDIYQCPRCGLYRCHALTDFGATKFKKSGRKPLLDIEYSNIPGMVIALNPDKYVPCEDGIYT